MTNTPYTFAKLDRSIIDQAASLYKEGLSIREVGARLGKSYASASLYLKAAGVKARPCARRKLALNETYFDAVDTPEKAYWLGFLLADGNVSTRSVRVSLKVGDREHVEKLRQAVRAGSEVKVQKNAVPGRWKATLVMSSTHMRDSLLQKGWDDFKNRGSTRIMRDIPENLRRHLLRGLFDGDGWVMETVRGLPLLGFVDAHKEPVRFYKELLGNAIGSLPGKVKRAGSRVRPKRAFNWKFANAMLVRAVAEYLYSEPGPFLQRKRDRFEELVGPL